MSERTKITPTCTHWGNYRIETDGSDILAVHNYEVDVESTPIGQSLLNTLDSGARVPQPMVRAGYLRDQHKSDGAGRGVEPFVPVSWEQALELAASALKRVRDEFGNESIYGGSYGWASAGRLHHAQSQAHRFLNLFGGYTSSVNSYSTAAGQVIMEHVLGFSFHAMVLQAPTPEDMAEHTRTLVLFGGSAMKNTQVNAGGIGKHSAKEQLMQLKRAGVDIINVSPVRDDAGDFLEAEWVAPRPNTDVALMLGIAHTLVKGDLHDKAFLEKYCDGFDRFLPYLMGDQDGQAKDASWAADITGVPQDTIEDITRRLAGARSVLGISWSLQRQLYGEQTYWMITTLGAMLGHIGQPGGGVAYGYGCIHNMGFGGRRLPPYSMGAFPQGKNPVERFIPVARIADMLNNPGGKLNYNGQQLTYPDTRLVYWAGGNPFHHHQDLNALRKAWAKPETVIVNEPFWTATARHADIVFPCTTSLERNDLGGSSYDGYLSPMRKAVEPFAQSRSDFDIFTALSDRLGFSDQFTEGRDEMAWVKHLYQQTRKNAAEKDVELPEFDEFWQGEQMSVTDQISPKEYRLEKFRRGPDANPLGTPSGKIEIYSQTIANFNYPDCHGHAWWFEREQRLGGKLAETYPLHLVSNQPTTQLHSQYDHGVTARNHKIKERQRARMNPNDAVARDISEGDVIRIYNQRGACLAGVELTDKVRPSVIELPTGAWFDPIDAEGTLEVHGNPNVLTADVGTSSLAQGCAAHSCLVDVELFTETLPEVTVFKQPMMDNLGK